MTSLAFVEIWKSQKTHTGDLFSRCFKCKLKDGGQAHTNHTQLFPQYLTELTGSYFKHLPVLCDVSRTLQHFCAIASREARGVLDTRPIIL